MIVLGCGGHAKSIVDSIESQEQFQIVGFIDNHTEGHGSYNVLGNDASLKHWFETGIKYACIGVGYLGECDTRDSLFKILKEIGFFVPPIIDCTAIVSKSVIVGEGCFIGKRAVVNRDVKLGKMVIINSGAIVEHDCEIGDFTHVSVGAIVCGGVEVGEHCMIGANATIVQEKKICSEVIVGAGSIVLGDVNTNQTVYGVVKESDGCGV